MRHRRRNDDAPHATRVEQAAYGVYDERNPADSDERLRVAVTKALT
jgi:hypothetical protein